MEKTKKTRWDRIRFEVVLTIITTFGVSFCFIAIEHLTKSFAVGLGIFFTLVIVLLILQRAKIEEEREEKENIKGKQDELKEEFRKKIMKETEEKRQEASNLLSKTIEFNALTLRLVSEGIQRIQKELNILDFNKTKIIEIIQDIKNNIIEAVLRNLRLIFESDPRGVDTTTYPHNYFKVAFFKKEKKDNKFFLHRTHYDYPEGIEPYEETEWVDIEKYQRAGHVLACQNQEIIFIEDIPSEIQKSPMESRWMDLRHNQNKEYKSMVCVPIVHGKKGTLSREVLGVLVIDTNRERYFLEKDPSYHAFLGRILNPFRTLLTIAIEIEKLQERI